MDGNWTVWSDWDACSTTCYAEGGQNRYRNCTNPAPEGDGLYCSGVDIEFQNCIPDLPICPCMLNATSTPLTPHPHASVIENMVAIIVNDVVYIYMYQMILCLYPYQMYHTNHNNKETCSLAWCDNVHAVKLKFVKFAFFFDFFHYN